MPSGWPSVVGTSRAVDISPTALRRGESSAARSGPDVSRRITWLQADLTCEPALPEASYDLVTAQFVHLPSEERQAMHLRLAAAVADGGTLLIVGHHPSDLHAGVGRWPMPDLMFTADQVAAVLDPRLWSIAVNEARPRTVTNNQGDERTVHDAVVTARRRSGR